MKKRHFSYPQGLVFVHQLPFCYNTSDVVIHGPQGIKVKLTYRYITKNTRIENGLEEMARYAGL